MCLRPQKLRKHHQCQASFVEVHVFHVKKEERWCCVDQTDQNHLREDLNYMQSKMIDECLFNSSILQPTFQPSHNCGIFN